MIVDYRIKRPDVKDLSFEVAAALDEHIVFHEGELVLRQTMESATLGQRAIYSCYWYEYEVCNGGHLQFFCNSTGIMWEDAIAGFNRLNASQYADILKAAVLLFPNGNPSKDRDKRIEQLDSIYNEYFEILDERFFNLREQEDFCSMLEKYINLNPDEFFIP